jgi:hypothetical protein
MYGLSHKQITIGCGVVINPSGACALIARVHRMNRSDERVVCIRGSP